MMTYGFIKYHESRLLPATSHSWYDMGMLSRALVFSFGHKKLLLADGTPNWLFQFDVMSFGLYIAPITLKKYLWIWSCVAFHGRPALYIWTLLYLVIHLMEYLHTMMDLIRIMIYDLKLKCSVWEGSKISESWV